MAQNNQATRRLTGGVVLGVTFGLLSWLFFPFWLALLIGLAAGLAGFFFGD